MLLDVRLGNVEVRGGPCCERILFDGEAWIQLLQGEEEVCDRDGAVVKSTFERDFIRRVLGDEAGEGGSELSIGVAA